MKRVLITGHGGFVGSHCLEYFLEHTDWELICIDSFRHKGTCRRVVEVGGDKSARVKTYCHDLTVPFDSQLENLIFERRIDNMGFLNEKPLHYILNIASESAVERSTIDPVSCLHNNWHLGVNMLEFARRCKGLELFIAMSTDEVYGEAPAGGAHKEWSPILPSNPYCVLPGTKIITKHGLINIEDFNPLKDTLCSRQKSRVVESFASKKFKHMYSGNTYTIYAGGNHIQCTEDHKLFKLETFYTEELGLQIWFKHITQTSTRTNC